MRFLLRLLLLLALLLGLLAGVLKWRYGGGEAFPDRSTAPLLDGSALDIVAALPYPPGNISADTPERWFFSFHPEARPPVNLALWENGDWRPFPSPEMQPGGTHPDALHEVLSVRLDRERRRLWALDTGLHGLEPPRLIAFDADTGELLRQHSFHRSIAGLGSHYNDFQISPDGRWIYIADASFFAKTPALVIYDVETQQARRLLDGHESVVAERYVPNVGGRRMEALGLVAIRPGVDSIALTADGEWLYFAPVGNNYLWRVATRHLRDEQMSALALAKKPERFALKTMSDGIAATTEGHILLTDPEHFAIHQISPSGKLQTIVSDPRLRWPDGLSLLPQSRQLFITASGLHHIIGRPPGAVKAHAPWHILRLQLEPGTAD